MATQPPYLPIQVGKAISNIDLGLQGDDEGDNISEKNKSYCELTGIYWAWKNLKDVDVIGLCHYRRYFDFHGQCHSVFPFTGFHTEKFQSINLDIPQQILNHIRNGKVVASKPIHFSFSLYIDYCVWHIGDDIRTLTEIIKETTSQKYINAFRNVMYHGYRLRPCNMFIMNWKQFDHYCNWLFPILKEAEKRIDISHYNDNQKRIWGYMAERLFNVYLYAEQLSVISKPVILIDDNWVDKKRPVLKERLKIFKNAIRSR